MHDMLRALGDPTIRGWYLIICFAVLVLPMVLLAWWYHSRIKRTAGGRELMERQARTPAHAGNVWQAFGMARDIAAGRYGDTARMMQNRVYWLIGLWLLVNVIGFGLLLWADEINRAPA
jgi:hypothetical protein